MTRRRKSTALAVAALVMGLVAVVASRTAEPRYQGRKLSSWLQQGWQTLLNETQRLAQAEEAIRAIGARNALPTLLTRLGTKDTRIRTWTIEKAEKYHIRFLHLNSATECQLQGIAGFEVLDLAPDNRPGGLARMVAFATALFPQYREDLRYRTEGGCLRNHPRHQIERPRMDNAIRRLVRRTRIACFTLGLALRIMPA